MPAGNSDVKSASRSLYAAAAEIAADNDLPPDRIAAIVAVLASHNLTRSRSAPVADEVSTAEAARILNVDGKTIRKYAKAGLLPYRDKAVPGAGQSRWLFRVADLERVKAYGFAPAAEPAPRRRRKTTTPTYRRLNFDRSF